MKTVLQNQNTFVFSIEKGQEVIQSLQQFCRDNLIQAGSFSFLGAAQEVELWWYDPGKKEYKKRTFKGQIEITGAQGNVSVFGSELVIHAHGTFSDKNYKVLGGHIRRVVVSGACEGVLEVFQGTIHRKYDEETGLNLME